MNRRSDYNPLLMLSSVFDRSKEEKYPKIPKNERTRQRPSDDRLQAKLELSSQHWKAYFAQPSLFIIFTLLVTT